MGNTTNNNWPTPVATDLVKDGWEAIKDLGDAIDTTLGVYAPSTPGLTLINTTSFSGVASQSINDCFSATYNAYKINFSCTVTTVGDIQLRFRVSGSDNSNNNYGSVSAVRKNDLVALQRVNQNSAVVLDSNTTAGGKAISIDVYDPFSASLKTKFLGTTSGIGSDTTAVQSGFTGGGFDANTSFTGLTWFVGSGTMTGSVSVFGYSL
jgi:hypothetical protein